VAVASNHRVETKVGMDVLISLRLDIRTNASCSLRKRSIEQDSI